MARGVLGARTRLFLQPPPPGFATWEDFAAAIGLPEERRGDLAAVVDPAGVGPRLLFQKVPEGKTAKNRVHLDVNAGAGAEGEQRRIQARAHADRLVAAGGTVLREVDEVTGWCLVMSEPEGNEFCVQ